MGVSEYRFTAVRNYIEGVFNKLEDHDGNAFDRAVKSYVKYYMCSWVYLNTDLPQLEIILKGCSIN